MNVPVRDIVRKKETLYSDPKLEKASDAELLDAMAKHPVLLNRPIVRDSRRERSSVGRVRVWWNYFRPKFSEACWMFLRPGRHANDYQGRRWNTSSLAN